MKQILNLLDGKIMSLRSGTLVVCVGDLIKNRDGQLQKVLSIEESVCYDGFSGGQYAYLYNTAFCNCSQNEITIDESKSSWAEFSQINMVFKRSTEHWNEAKKLL